MFEPINRVIKKNQLANPSLLLTPQICYLADTIVKELIPEAKEKIRIVSFKDSRLKISSDDPTLLHKIKMNEEEIVKRVQKRIKIKTFRIIYLPKE
ncbi:MAG: hypothetical protein NT039_01100 [Candidatus Berkelbacteria bacterium]|nr:hypothetical protein [Candidatus Berkelbacteria bacterium]